MIFCLAIRLIGCSGVSTREGLYRGLRGGTNNIIDSAEVTSRAQSSRPVFDVVSRLERDYAESGALGNALGDGWQVEGAED